MKKLKEAYAQWQRATEDYVVGREDDCARADELNEAEQALIDLALEALPDLIAAVEALAYVNRCAMTENDWDQQTVLDVLKRLGVE